MKSAVAVRHIHFEDLGVLEPCLQNLGYDVRYVDAGMDDIAAIDPYDPDLIVILGAPIGANDQAVYPFLADEFDLVRQRLKTARPILGICLGAQIIARALGAAVEPMGVKEIGFSPLNLTEAGQSSPLAALGDAPVLHWHGDQFAIPTAAARLAWTTVCANQAFAIGEAVLGLQFHLEADPRTIERWLVGHACELGLAGLDPVTIRRQAAEFGPALAGLAPKVIEAWLAETRRPA